MRRVIVSLALLVPSLASAQTIDVNDLIHQGVELRRARRDRDALLVFQRAWEVSHEPRVLAQIGFAELALGRWVDAEAHLIEALGAARDPWITARRGLLEEALRDVGQHVGSLEVRGNVPGAEVRVEGRRVGALPFTRPARVAAGTTTLEVMTPGYLPVRRSLVVTAGALTRESVTLLGVDASGTVLAGPASAGGSAQPAPDLPGARASADPRRLLRVLAWSAAGGAALATGIGVAALVTRNNAVYRWNSDDCLAGNRTRRENCGDEEDTAMSAQGLSIAGFVTGAALAVTSVVLFVTMPTGRGREGAARFGCGVGPGDVGVTCGASL